MQTGRHVVDIDGKGKSCASLARRCSPNLYVAIMFDEIALHRRELRALCRRFHVRRLDLFGSAARGDFDPERSDTDFLVEFDRAHPDALSLRTYFGLKEALA